MPLGDDFRRRLKEILSCPTAPFHEEHVHKAILDVVAASGRLRAKSDAFGNLEVVYGKGRPQLLFTCHTDHPALEANGDGTATIQGGMHARQLRGTGVRPFHGGRVATIGGMARGGGRGVVQLRGGKGLKKGTPLVLDLPAYRLTDRHIRARAIDDLCAVAACLTLLDRLAAARWRGCVGILFTRAEEVGFVGALGWSGLRRYPRTTTLINLEMSSALKHTPQGAGPILRVGDRVTTFTHGAALELEAAARALAKRDRHFRYQRALMDGGGCEATVYVFSGFRTGALCLPLKNYHNHAARGGMGLEYVYADDAENLVRWMVEYTRSFGRLHAWRGVERRLATLLKKHRGRLARTAKGIR